MRNYGVCDELCYKLPEQDFKLRWDLYSWPKKITDECVELEEKCIRLENKQQIEMEEVRIPVWNSTRPSTPSSVRGGSRRRRGGPAASQGIASRARRPGIDPCVLAGPGRVRMTLKYYRG